MADERRLDPPQPIEPTVTSKECSSDYFGRAQQTSQSSSFVDLAIAQRQLPILSPTTLASPLNYQSITTLLEHQPATRDRPAETIQTTPREPLPVVTESRVEIKETSTSTQPRWFTQPRRRGRPSKRQIPGGGVMYGSFKFSNSSNRRQSNQITHVRTFSIPGEDGEKGLKITDYSHQFNPYH